MISLNSDNNKNPGRPNAKKMKEIEDLVVDFIDNG
jgi:hypothetical protein